MKNLYILRHAKSSWDDFTLKDFDRPLSTRGIPVSYTHLTLPTKA